ncbi:BREX-1 system adenine-specific DNA-methyltransferase PglX [Gordonia sp. WA4-43]|uniref:BREX-1 system adenine-specific DNA-methyltransferase PglX n=1 Tax=Gordonia sp. WA4-43 TaxID=2878678 RepID=UPI0021F56E6D|nr:BREX-1 system adenine-specific DNA-methyltransferase PglX [Gordonia sp. WA4-43]
MFLERGLEIACSGASVAMVTKHQWMFIDSYKRFRANFPSVSNLSSLVHLGTGAFDSISGEIVQAAAFIMDVGRGIGSNATYIRLCEVRGADAKRTEFLNSVRSQESEMRFEASAQDFMLVPNSPLAYWMSVRMKRAFRENPALSSVSDTRSGVNTGDNSGMTRIWSEVDRSRFSPGQASEEEFRTNAGVWCPYNKGGAVRHWYGNQSTVVKFDEKSTYILAHQGNNLPSRELYFRSSISWSKMGGSSFRAYPAGFIFDNTGPCAFPQPGVADFILGYLNSSTARHLLSVISATLDVMPGQVARLPFIDRNDVACTSVVGELVNLFRADWDRYETSWDFRSNPLSSTGLGLLDGNAKHCWDEAIRTVNLAQALEEGNNRYFAQIYELKDEVDCGVPVRRISLTQNPYFRYLPKDGVRRTDDEYRTLFDLDLARELVSYAVGCMMGRYSLDQPGLILADAGATIADFEEKVPNARFRPDADGIIPITAEHYFEDDIVSRMREFLSVAFGKENVEANVAWLEFALGSGKRKSLRDYFLKDFYNDHVKTYSRRPIYWQVSSNPKTDKGFNALFYLHRYTPATLGIIRENYANQMTDKQQARLETIEHALPTAGKAEATKLSKERDQLTTQRREIREWITNKLFPLSTAEVKLDLDDGVKQNYPKLKDVLRKVTGL